MTQDADTRSLAKRVRRHLVEMTAVSKSSHIGSCLSITDVLCVLYGRVLHVDPREPRKPGRDRFILSKAHGGAAVYAVLAETGFFSTDILGRYYVDDGLLPGHLDATLVPGVETSGGSLGHGLSLGIGMALANRTDQNAGRVFVLLGDGECNEGSVWEAVMLAAQLKLTNLTALIDCNGIQGFGNTDDIISQANMAERWKTFGWQALEVDGHDHVALETALRAAPQSAPRAVIMHTVKGKGISFMENKLEWHYRSPNPDERKRALEELALEEFR